MRRRKIMQTLAGLLAAVMLVSTVGVEASAVEAFEDNSATEVVVETSEEFSGEVLEGEVADDGYVENDGDSEAADEIGSAEDAGASDTAEDEAQDEAGVSDENKENEGTGEDIEAEESDETDELDETEEDGETDELDELGGLKDSEKDVDEEAELQAGSAFFEVVGGTLTLIEGQESNFNGATECVIPDDCEEIPANIFVNKRNLAKITFNDSSKLNDIAFGAFEGCGVKTLIIPKGVTTVGDSTFKGCKSLTNITFRGTLTEIGDYAFAECESLTVVNDISSVTSIGRYAFDNCGVFKNANLESAKTIGDYAFRNCYKLMSLNLSKDLESIGISAFKATGISSLTIPDMNSEVVSLEDGIFESCPNLTSVTWPGCITTIPANTFKGCISLSSVTIGDGVGVISAEAFRGCSSITQILFPQSVYRFEDKALADCNNLTKLTVRYPEEGLDLDIEDGANAAFPSTSHRVILTGYHNALKNYADKHNNYYFEYAKEKHSLSTETKDGKGSITLSALSAVEGTVVTVTLRPETGYTVKALECETNSMTKIPVNFLSTSKNEFTYNFTMPNEAVKVSAVFTKTSQAVTGELEANIKGISGFYNPLEIDEGCWELESVGTKAQFKMVAGGNEVDSWLVKYSTSNAKVVSVDSNGYLLATGIGTATVKAVLNSDTKKWVQAKVTVRTKDTVKKMELSFDNLPIELRKSEEGGKTVIWATKGDLEKGNISFDVTLKAGTEVYAAGKELIMNSQWTSMDTGIATVPGTVTAARNTVTIKKGAEGESYINVKIVNDKETTNEDLKTVETGFIVKVIDNTPRLDEKKISINYDSTIGTVFRLTPVYGSVISETGLTVMKKNSRGGYDDASNIAAFRKVEGDDMYSLCAADNVVAEGKSVTYKGATQLYLSGSFTEETGGGKFYIPVNEVTITRKKLSPTIKYSGKINLFYNCGTQESGSVTVTQSLTNEKLTAATLVSEANHKLLENGGVTGDDAFANNFRVDVDESGKSFKVSLKVNPGEMTTDSKGKPVVSGYVHLKYNGYTTYGGKDYIALKISIPTCNTKPSVILDKTSATCYQGVKNQRFVLKVLNKSDKQPIPLNLSDNVSINELTSTAKNYDVDIDIDGCIVLEARSYVEKGKTVLNVRKHEWAESIPVTFSTSTATALPKATLSSGGKIPLDNMLLSQTKSVTVSLNQSEAKVSSLLISYDGNAKLASEADKIEVGYDPANGLVTAKLTEKTAKGTYKFKIVPNVVFTGQEGSTPVSPCYVNVTVADTVPGIKLSSGTLTMNVKMADATKSEKVTIGMSATKLPAGTTYSWNNGSTEIKGNNDAAQAFMNTYLHLYVDASSEKIIAKWKNNPAPVAFNYSYTVSGLAVDIEGSDGTDTVTIPDFKFSVKGIYKSPTVSFKNSGSINPIDPTSAITYTITVKDIANGANSVALVEYDADGKQISFDDRHFEFQPKGPNPDGSYVVAVTAKEGKVLDTKTKYRYQLVCHLENDDTTPYYSPVYTVTPKQTFPKVKAVASATSVYAGQNRDRIIKVDLSTSGVTNCKMTDVTFASNTPQNIKDAFEISFNQETMQVTLRLKNASKVVANKKNTITLVTQYKNQMSNSTGTSFKVDVTVKK